MLTDALCEVLSYISKSFNQGNVRSVRLLPDYGVYITERGGGVQNLKLQILWEGEKNESVEGYFS